MIRSSFGLRWKFSGTDASDLGDVLEQFVRDARLDRIVRIGGLEPLPGGVEAGLDLSRGRLDVVDLVVNRLELVAEGFGEGLGLIDRKVARHDQVLGVELLDARPVLDLLVHDRLGERRLVPFVVAVAAVADHVDDDVLTELLAEVEGQFGDMDDRLGIFAVDVEDRDLDHLGHVGAVSAGTALTRGRGEADLVVHDDVDGAAGAISGQLGEVQRLGDQPLAREGGVAVDQDRDAELTIAVQEPPLLGPHSSLDHWVDGLKVARVWRQ